MGLVAQGRVESSQTRDRILVSCIGQWILCHWATREVPASLFFKNSLMTGLTWLIHIDLPTSGSLVYRFCKVPFTMQGNIVKVSVISTSTSVGRHYSTKYVLLEVLYAEKISFLLLFSLLLELYIFAFGGQGETFLILRKIVVSYKVKV